jgi:hypothetical protein
MQLPDSSCGNILLKKRKMLNEKKTSCSKEEDVK